MKYIKKFEEINQGSPQEGDYVICISNNKTYDRFFRNRIGKIIKINIDLKYSYYDITFDNIPNMLYTRIINGDRVIGLKIDSIKYFSKDKEELEQILITNKFNI